MDATWIGHIMTRELITLRGDIEAATDDAMLWATPPGVSNSIGTLALHLAGNLQHFVGSVLGQTGYVRRRELEFSRRDVPRAELLAEVDRASAVVKQVFGGQPIDLAGEYPERIGGAYLVMTGDWLAQLAVHLAYHVGQASYLRRLLTGAGAAPVPAMGIGGLATARKVS